MSQTSGAPSNKLTKMRPSKLTKDKSVNPISHTEMRFLENKNLVSCSVVRQDSEPDQKMVADGPTNLDAASSLIKSNLTILF